MAYRRGQSGFLPDDGQPIEERHLVAALRFAAYVVVRYGDKYVPPFERLEEPLAEFRAKQKPIERAKEMFHTKVIGVM